MVEDCKWAIADIRLLFGGIKCITYTWSVISLQYFDYSYSSPEIGESGIADGTKINGTLIVLCHADLYIWTVRKSKGVILTAYEQKANNMITEQKA